MRRLSAELDSSARRVPSNVRRVALGATSLALVVYVLACVVAYLAVANRLVSATDTRLSTRLAEIAETSPRGAPVALAGTYAGGSSGDLDDAPIVVWWLAPGSRHAVSLLADAPTLPAAGRHLTGPTDMTIAGRDFRLTAITLDGGRLVAGTSAQGSRSALSTLLVIEASLAPIVLLTLYGAAWVIGRRAAAPVERARQRQLEFTADASHELRTPLSVIEAELGLALNTERSPAAYRTALERVAAESKRLRYIVDDLLWLARLEGLPAQPPSEPVELSSVVEVCVTRFTAVAAGRGISISSTGDGKTPAIVVAPADWLDRLVSVLLDNACRYANEAGQVEVGVSLTRDRVVLTVDDSGPGIADAERENIFRRFHRVSSVPGGAGLGLSIANAVVEATGGDWDVARSPLGGARIEVSWPSEASWRPLSSPASPD
ncbi:MAG: two-component sensor histidine kinase [Acidimicrobiaceae bacterium]|nr:two-component sensor histidine kinase [Acidimicrobiaceae bacterium]